MYDNVVISVRACNGETNEFSINMRLHQRSTLSPCIFVLIMDEDTKDIQCEILWCMIFANNVVLMYESMMGVDRHVEANFRIKGF